MTEFDEGGYLPPGWVLVINDTGEPEPVIPISEIKE